MEGEEKRRYEMRWDGSGPSVEIFALDRYG